MLDIGKMRRRAVKTVIKYFAKLKRQNLMNETAVSVKQELKAEMQELRAGVE